MKKLLIVAGFVLAMTGLAAAAQTEPATATTKTEKTAMGKGQKHGKKHHHHKQHAAKPAPAQKTN